MALTIQLLTATSPVRLAAAAANGSRPTLILDPTSQSGGETTEPFAPSVSDVTIYNTQESQSVTFTGDNIGTLDIQTPPDSTYADASIDGNTLVITPKATGTTSVTVVEQNNNQTATININVVDTPTVDISSNADSNFTGSATAFTATPNGQYDSVTYEWYYNTQDVAGSGTSGGSGATYNFTPNSAGTYYVSVVATYRYGTAEVAVTSTTKQFIAIQAPTLSITPQNMTTAVGNSINYSVEDISSNYDSVQYQWYYNTQNAAGTGSLGGTQSTYTFTPDAVGTYYISVVATVTSGNLQTTITSKVATLQVQEANYSITTDVGTTYYNNLAVAYTNALDGQTIKVEKDLTENSIITMTKNITIDTQNYTMNVIQPLMITGTNTVTITGSGTVHGNITNSNPTIAVLGSGTVNITGPTISRSSTVSGPTVLLYGGLNMSSGKITADVYSAIYTYAGSTGKVNITGGSIETTNSTVAVCLNSENTCNIQNATLSAKEANIITVLGNKNTVEIGGETTKLGVSDVDSSPAIAIATGTTENKVTITGGTINSASNAVNINGTNNIVDISGANTKLTSTGEQTPTIYMHSENTCNINGATIEQTGNSIAILLAGNNITTEISGDSTNISAAATAPIAFNTGATGNTLKILGGTISSTKNVLNLGGTTNNTIEISGANTKLTSSGENYPAIYMESENTCNINGATIEQTGNSAAMAITGNNNNIEINGDSTKITSATATPVSFAEGVTGNTFKLFGGTISSTTNAINVDGSNNTIEINGENTLITSSGEDYPAIYMHSGNTLKMAGGTINQTGHSAAIALTGDSNTAEITGGKLYSNANTFKIDGSNNVANVSGANTIISSATQTNNPTFVIDDTGTENNVTIAGGTINNTGNSNAIGIDGNNNNVEISGDVTNIISGDGANAIHVDTATTGNICKITGGNIRATNSNVISGGNFTLEISGVHTLVASEVNDNYPSIMLDAGSNCTITGGTIQNNKTIAVLVKANATLNVGNSTDALSTTSPALIGTHGVYSEGTWNFYNGILKGTTAGYYGEPATLRNGCTMANGTDGNYKTVYLQQ